VRRPAYNPEREAEERAENARSRTIAGGALTLDALIAKLQEIREESPDLGACPVGFAHLVCSYPDEWMQDETICAVRTNWVSTPSGTCACVQLEFER
jgi:hypothetical protein